MLPGHALVTLAEAKEALRIRTTDTQADALILRDIATASDMVESITGRHIVYRGMWRHEEDGVLVASAELTAKGTVALTGGDISALGATVSVVVTLAGTLPTACFPITITGSLAGVPVEHVLYVQPDRTYTPGWHVFDAITKVEVGDGFNVPQPEPSDPPADPPEVAACTVNVYAVSTYHERHSCEGGPSLWVVHRPIISLLVVEEGTAPVQLFPLDPRYYVVNEALGRIGRIAKTVGFIDFPEDYFFRYASQVENQWGAWSPDARIGYVGGYRYAAEIPGGLRDACLRGVAGLYRERERKDVDATTSGQAGGTVTKANWRQEMADALKGDIRLSSTGEGLPA